MLIINKLQQKAATLHDYLNFFSYYNYEAYISLINLIINFFVNSKKYNLKNIGASVTIIITIIDYSNESKYNKFNLIVFL